MSKRHLIPAAALLAALSSAALAAEQAGQQQVAQAAQLAQAGGAARAAQAGVAGAVRGRVQQVSLTTPATVGRDVVSGDQIFLGDRIDTGAEAGLQVMLMDQTVFQIGPNASLKIDEFVYNPETNAGKLTASIAKGAFRFVTGRIAQRDPASMTVNLPVATVGIRGTIVAGVTDGTSATVILVGPGKDNNTGERAGRILVSNAGSVVEISRPGFATSISSNALPPQAPARATTAQMNQVNQGLNATGQRAQQPPQQQAQGQQQPGQQQQGQQQQGQQQPGQQQQGQQQPGQQQQDQQQQGQQQPGQQQQGQQQQGQQQQVQQQPGQQTTQQPQAQQMQGQPVQGQPVQGQPVQGQQQVQTVQPQGTPVQGAPTQGTPIQGGQPIASTSLATTSGSSIARTSGQTVGGAVGNLQTVQNVQGIQTGALNPATQVAQQEQTIRAGVATFEEMRRITTGTAVYAISNVPMSGNGSGSYNFNGTVDFARMTAVYSVDGRYTLGGVSGTFNRQTEVKDYRLDHGEARTVDQLFVNGGPGVGRPGEHRGQFELSLNNNDRRFVDFARTRATISNGTQTVSGGADVRRP